MARISESQQKSTSRRSTSVTPTTLTTASPRTLTSAEQAQAQRIQDNLSRLRQKYKSARARATDAKIAKEAKLNAQIARAEDRGDTGTVAALKQERAALKARGDTGRAALLRTGIERYERELADLYGTSASEARDISVYSQPRGQTVRETLVVRRAALRAESEARFPEADRVRLGISLSEADTRTRQIQRTEEKITNTNAARRQRERFLKTKEGYQYASVANALAGKLTTESSGEYSVQSLQSGGPGIGKATITSGGYSALSDTGEAAIGTATYQFGLPGISPYSGVASISPLDTRPQYSSAYGYNTPQGYGEVFYFEQKQEVQPPKVFSPFEAKTVGELRAQGVEFGKNILTAGLNKDSALGATRQVVSSAGIGVQAYAGNQRTFFKAVESKLPSPIQKLGYYTVSQGAYYGLDVLEGLGKEARYNPDSVVVQAAAGYYGGVVAGRVVGFGATTLAAGTEATAGRLATGSASQRFLGSTVKGAGRVSSALTSFAGKIGAEGSIARATGEGIGREITGGSLPLARNYLTATNIGGGALLGGYVLTKTPQELGASLPGFIAFGSGFTQGITKAIPPTTIEFGGFKTTTETSTQFSGDNIAVTAQGVRTARISEFGVTRNVEVPTNLILSGSRTIRDNIILNNVYSIKADVGTTFELGGKNRFQFETYTGSLNAKSGTLELQSGEFSFFGKTGKRLNPGETVLYPTRSIATEGGSIKTKNVGLIKSETYNIGNTKLNKGDFYEKRIVLRKTSFEDGLKLTRERTGNILLINKKTFLEVGEPILAIDSQAKTGVVEKIIPTTRERSVIGRGLKQRQFIQDEPVFKTFRDAFIQREVYNAQIGTRIGRRGQTRITQARTQEQNIIKIPRTIGKTQQSTRPISIEGFPARGTRTTTIPRIIPIIDTRRQTTTILPTTREGTILNINARTGSRTISIPDTIIKPTTSLDVLRDTSTITSQRNRQITTTNTKRGGGGFDIFVDTPTPPIVPTPIIPFFPAFGSIGIGGGLSQTPVKSKTRYTRSLEAIEGINFLGTRSRRRRGRRSRKPLGGFTGLEVRI